MAKADTGQLIVLYSFIGNVDGADVAFRAGDTIDANHKAVKKWPQFFGEPKATVHQVEQATAAPGEKRGE